jgi:hypothetical protein
MAVVTKEQMMEQVKAVVGENTDDATLKFLEDLNDTFNDLETKAQGDGEDWKSKYEQNDKEWRERYQKTFFSGTKPDQKDEPKNDLTEPTEEPTEQDNNEPQKFEDLFTTENK